MDIQREIDRVMQCLDSGRCISELIAADEAKAGRRVIRPGAAEWLPVADWRPGTVCSISGTQVRLILLDAQEPGRGAFTRLIRALASAGFPRPYVVSPTLDFRATLKRAGWRPVTLKGADAMRAPGAARGGR